jgi:hypothetical protein
MTTVTVNGPGTLTGEMERDGTTYYGWTFNVTVNGQAGVYTVWVDSNDPSNAYTLDEDVIEDLQQDPGAMEGITNDGPAPDQDDMGDFPDDDGDDEAVASNGGGDFGDSV